MTRFGFSTNRGQYNTPPEKLQLELNLDLVVDNELPEEERAAVLRRVEEQPGQWRSLALRFLERQTERTAVRDLMDAPAANNLVPAVHPQRFPSWVNLRAAAALLIVASVAAAAGHYMGRHGQPAEITSGGGGQSVAVALPASVVGAPINVSVPLTRAQAPALPVNSANNETQHLVIMPLDKERAVVFPLTTTNKGEIN